MLRDAHVCKLLPSLLWSPLPTEAFLFVYQDRFLKPESIPLEQSKKKPTLGWHYGGDTFVFLQYFLTRASKYRITRLHGGPGPACSQLQLSCIVPLSCQSSPQPLHSYTHGHLRPPPPGGRAPSSLEGGNSEPSLSTSGDAHPSLSWRFLSGKYQLLEAQQRCTRFSLCRQILRNPVPVFTDIFYVSNI